MNIIVDFKDRWQTHGKYAGHPENARLTLLYDEIVDLYDQYNQQASVLKLTNNPDTLTIGNRNLWNIKEEINTLINKFTRTLQVSSSSSGDGKKVVADKWVRPGSVSPRPKRGIYKL